MASGYFALEHLLSLNEIKLESVDGGTGVKDFPPPHPKFPTPHIVTQDQCMII